MSGNTLIKISVVIPAKNGAGTIESCLQGIIKQTLFSTCEIIIIDSGSTDGTLEIIKKYPVRLYQIPPEDFNHGATRNYGVSLAKGEFVVMTVQDAIPNDNQWLEKMVRHFEDTTVAGVCGGQMVPHRKDYNPHQWFRPQNTPKEWKVQFTKEEYERIDKASIAGLDDVNAMYRIDLLRQYTFKKVDYGEDMLWQHEILSRGYAIVFDMNARVQHYHHQTFDYCYKNTIVNLYHQQKFYGKVKPIKYTVSDYLIVIYRNFRYNAHPQWIIHQWLSFYARTLAFRQIKKAIKKNTLELFYQEKIKKIPQGSVNGEK